MMIGRAPVAGVRGVGMTLTFPLGTSRTLKRSLQLAWSTTGSVGRWRRVP